ncbi:SDR family oxidoreductase [Altererythrobacter arenosus]|uniref:SDR family oxidoreductase n=1 Tax=Altererythrobacter arenosus TaxID=3032592 RepID=A0ABY8FVL4_9SPHN|nr:SDR family oxidoreductase [Altererythrobacter sp. CAU 1644]WFL78772.1 SDR family oxidoreductase [Altererythrobacter sp. CAU 1644]
MGRLFIFGLGYTAGQIAEALEKCGWQVDATGSKGNFDFGDEAAVREALANASHLLSSVPPDRESGGDPVLERYGNAIQGRWIGYLSSTGVYGDTEGAWVDESAPTVTSGASGRRNARAEVDQKWLEIGARAFRLPGIYGPGRSALDRVREGKARRIDLPGQVFSRVHVDDIVAGVVAAIDDDAPPGVYNLADDLPASGNAVIEEACRLLEVDPPPLQSIEEAGLSEMARGFYAENRRVANGKAKRLLGWHPQYPTYREGLSSLL